MQLQMEWEHFVRGVILDSATGKFTDGAGSIVVSCAANIPTRELAGHYLVSKFPKSNWEPNWTIPREAIRAAQSLQVSNEVTIAKELGISPWELDGLRHLRNFIAHRSKSAALKMRWVGLVGTTQTIDPISISYSYNSHGVAAYVSWVQFMKYVSRRLVA